ncbi:hypothetical protein NDU88_009823 [Pleurodeles waltl]|uniref:Uncharacterized protein n=1 Tax=Pleurodeles waltl TaxID=8319 RepID=A0AAV7PT69_PLEWA|nr:hypothetical protein NDU88_009823 [Pleurodeles waltl]
MRLSWERVTGGGMCDRDGISSGPDAAPDGVTLDATALLRTRSYGLGCFVLRAAESPSSQEQEVFVE